jgi:antitoxin MazE
MLTRIQKWGNSLGLRIPKSFALEAQFKEGSPVDLAVEDGKLIVRPLHRTKYSLVSLTREIHAKNIHEAADTGSAVGREIW